MTDDPRNCFSGLKESWKTSDKDVFLYLRKPLSYGKREHRGKKIKE